VQIGGLFDGESMLRASPTVSWGDQEGT